MTEEILFAPDGQTLHLTLNRPQRGNRITASMASAIAAVLHDDSPIRSRAVVIEGADGAFCLGGDFAAEGDRAEAHLHFGRNFAAMCQAVRAARIPVVAAVNGDAHAGGMGLVACCDLVVMSEDATLALPELLNGLFPILAMAMVRRLLPRPLFFDLVYRGRALTAEEALHYGLVTEIRPANRVHDRAMEMGRELSALSPTAIRIGRQAYHAMSAMTEADAVEHARHVLPMLLKATAGEREMEG